MNIFKQLQIYTLRRPRLKACFRHLSETFKFQFLLTLSLPVKKKKYNAEFCDASLVPKLQQTFICTLWNFKENFQKPNFLTARSGGLSAECQFISALNRLQERSANHKEYFQAVFKCSGVRPPSGGEHTLNMQKRVFLI